MAETTKGNPEVGMKADSLEAAAQVEKAKTDSGSVDSFFEQLENQVNGGIQETEQVTQQQQSGPKKVTHNQENAGPEENVTPIKRETNHDWEKRYKDSSKEAVKLKDEMSGVKPFMPVLEAMKKDPGLVQHVREYLQNGGEIQNKSLEEKLGLDEDFVFDLQEAVADPNSDSAKYANVFLGNIVNQRVGAIVDQQQKQVVQQEMVSKRAALEEDFKKRNNMSDEDFIAFAEEAKKRTLTLDDVNYLLNRDKANKNVAKSTKQDMLNQMKNVRNMPTSASAANSVSKGNPREDDALFDALAGLDGGVDNLFG